MIILETTSLSTSVNFYHADRMKIFSSPIYGTVVWCWYTCVFSVTTSHVSTIGPTHWNECCLFYKCMV